MVKSQNVDELLRIQQLRKEGDLEVCGHGSLPLTFASNSLCVHCGREYQDRQVSLEYTVCDQGFEKDLSHMWKIIFILTIVQYSFVKDYLSLKKCYDLSINRFNNVIILFFHPRVDVSM